MMDMKVYRMENEDRGRQLIYFYILKKCVQTYLPSILCSPRHGHNTCFTISLLILLRSPLDANYATSFAAIRDPFVKLRL